MGHKRRKDLFMDGRSRVPKGSRRDECLGRRGLGRRASSYGASFESAAPGPLARLSLGFDGFGSLFRLSFLASGFGFLTGFFGRFPRLFERFAGLFMFEFRQAQVLASGLGPLFRGGSFGHEVMGDRACFTPPFFLLMLSFHSFDDRLFSAGRDDNIRAQDRTSSSVNHKLKG